MSAKPEPGSEQPAPTEDKKETPVDGEQINLRVQNQDNVEVYFKIKRHTPLRKLMDAYCQRQGVNPNSIRFLYDGQRVQPERTPKEYGMENNDVIDVALQQTGGY
eukprot:gene1313-1657_t